MIPDVQVSPLGGILLWGAVLVVAVALVGSTGLGGAAIFALAGVVVLLVLFFLTRRVIGRLSGRRGRGGRRRQ